MTDRVRWGVIGLGVGNQHALTLLADEHSELVAVCDSNHEVLRSIGATYGDVELYSDAETMLAEAQLDAVSVASYDWDHATSVVVALECGVHVFAEKPVGTTWDDYRAIAELLNRHPAIRLSTNTLLRRSPRFAWLNSAIKRGEFGELVHIEADYLYGRLPKLTRGWRGTQEDYSVTLGGGIHMVDLVLWLAGERPTTVTAIGSSAGILKSAESDRTRFRGHSLRTALLSFPSGLTAKVSANFASVGPHFHRLDVFGTEATFMNIPKAPLSAGGPPESTGLLLTGADPGTATEIDLPYPAVPKGSLLPEFSLAVLTGEPTAISEQDALDALAVCLAIDESVGAREPVEISYETVTARR
jgi:predicted dehydrogenase